MDQNREKIRADYEAECACLRRELQQLHDQCAKLEQIISDSEKDRMNAQIEIEYLRGQVKAFEFCVTRGKKQ